MGRKLIAVLGTAVAALLVTLACTGPAGPRGPQGPQGERGLAGPPGPAASAPEPAPAYKAEVAHQEAYWYSRYSLGHLVMRSGMGVQLMPPMEKVQRMMQMAGITEGPVNPYLVKAVYSSGDPHMATSFNGNADDFANFRWDPERMDTTITPQAMGYTIIKEVIWSKSFASDVEGPDPMNHFRALVLSTEAVAQAQFMMENLRTPSGLFIHSWKDGASIDTTVLPQDQMVMLWAFSELADYSSGRYGWYAAPLEYERALALTDGLFQAILDQTSTQAGFLTTMATRDLGMALSAVSVYVNYAASHDLERRATEEVIPSVAAELLHRMDERGKLVADGGYSQMATQGAAVNGLVYAFKVTGAASYREAALQSWAYLETLWDETAKVYRPFQGATRYAYTPRDAADVVAAFNALLNGLGMDVDQRFANFFNGAINRSGLQLAEGAPTGGGQDDDAIPDPFSTGGEFGQAPVLATEAVYDVASSDWSLTNPRFTTAYDMALANQMMWIGTWAGKASVPGHGIPG